MKQWALFVLRKVYGTTKSKVVVLIDETDLLFGYQAIVVAIPFRMRAIPIYWHIYTNEQIQDLVYLSHNTLIWDFLNKLNTVQHQALGKRRRFVWIFDRGFADVKLMIKLKKWRVGFIIRVCRNVGVEVQGYVGQLSAFPRTGYYENIIYHKEKRIRVNLYCAWDDNYDDPMLLVSNQACNLLMLYSQRMKIEEAFRDLKSLFGFRSLVLKDNSQQRIELLWLMCVMSMGLSFLLYEKSGLPRRGAISRGLPRRGAISRGLPRRGAISRGLPLKHDTFLNLCLCASELPSASRCPRGGASSAPSLSLRFASPPFARLHSPDAWRFVRGAGLRLHGLTVVSFFGKNSSFSKNYTRH
jgi:hypothetical protein